MIVVSVRGLAVSAFHPDTSFPKERLFQYSNSVLEKLLLRISEHPCYGSGLEPRSVPCARKLPLPNLTQEVIFLRNIFGRKCHELYSGLLTCGLAALASVCLFACPLLLAQQPPPPIPTVAAPPPPPAEVPNAANPDQRLKNLRPGAPGPDEYTL